MKRGEAISEEDSDGEEGVGLDNSKELERARTVWTDGSRQENGEVGAACVWATQEG